MTKTKILDTLFIPSKREVNYYKNSNYELTNYCFCVKFVN
jgi:hypothetical protein